MCWRVESVGCVDRCVWRGECVGCVDLEECVGCGESVHNESHTHPTQILLHTHTPTHPCPFTILGQCKGEWCVEGSGV